jgi:glycosyltransferase involved in cell wall biosynthesis
MDTRPLVSCIIIFLDAERFLREAIDSILAQAYDTWELLLVDDGSSDGSTAIAREFATEHPTRIRYLEHPDHVNRGMSASRNLGARSSRGDYLAFPDADDVWVPDKLTEQVQLLEAHPRAAMLYGRSLIWYSWSKNPDAPADHLYDLGVEANRLIEPPRLVFLILENRVQTPTTCNALIRRRVYEEVGGFQEAFRGMFEDQAFFIKLCLSRPVYVADACWAWYRQHDESCCAVAERSGVATALRLPLLEWAEGYFASQGIRDPRLRLALFRELVPYRYPWIPQLRKGPRYWIRGARKRMRAALNRLTHPRPRDDKPTRGAD